jgi:hypothetical protein
MPDATRDPDMFRGDMARWTGRVGLAGAPPAVADQRLDHRLSVSITSSLGHILLYRNETIRGYRLERSRQRADAGTGGQLCGPELISRRVREPWSTLLFDSDQSRNGPNGSHQLRSRSHSLRIFVVRQPEKRAVPQQTLISSG